MRDEGWGWEWGWADTNCQDSHSMYRKGDVLQLKVSAYADNRNHQRISTMTADQTANPGGFLYLSALGKMKIFPRA